MYPWDTIELSQDDNLNRRKIEMDIHKKICNEILNQMTNSKVFNKGLSVAELNGHNFSGADFAFCDESGNVVVYRLVVAELTGTRRRGL